jgi:hypothetical protein
VSESNPATETPVLRVVSGSPTAEELAVVTALLARGGGGGDAEPETGARRGGWSDPAAGMRPMPRPGVNGWRAAAQP